MGVAADPHRAGAGVHLAAGRPQKVQKSGKVAGAAAADGHVAPGGRHRGGVGGGGDAVGHRGKGAAVQPAGPAVDDHHRRARPGDARPAGVQKGGQVLHLRLAGGAPQHGGALGAGRGHQQRLGGAHAGQAQRKVRAVQPPGPAQHHRVGGKLDLRAHGGQAVQVDIHRAGPQPAAARHGHAHLPHPHQQRRKVKHRAAHRPRQPRGDIAAQQRHGAGQDIPPPAGGLGPHRAQQRQAGVHVGQAGHAPQPAWLAAQQRGRQKRQHAVFGRRRRNAARQRASAPHLDDLHAAPPPLPVPAAPTRTAAFPQHSTICRCLPVSAPAGRANGDFLCRGAGHSSSGCSWMPRSAQSSVSGISVMSLFRLLGLWMLSSWPKGTK